MGGQSSKQALEVARERARRRSGSLQVSGRYHRLPKVLSDDYVVSQTVLGTGFSGSVVMAKSRRTPSKGGTETRFAVKSIQLTGIRREVKLAVQAEVEVFLSVDHPHVCRLYDVYESESRVDLVMECLEGGELHDRLNHQHFTEKDAADAAYQMLLAVNYLHSLGIVHRDIKLENFMYDKRGGNHLKLIDFGFSSSWEPDKAMKLGCGTLCYVAPEVILKSYTNMCDLWSLGVVVFLLLVGYMPFPMLPDLELTELAILNGNYVYDEAKWSRVSPTAFDFVKGLLNRDPAERMTAEQALVHPWIMGREELSASESFVDESVLHAFREYGKASKFRRACMQMMAWSLTNEERADVRAAFIELDREKTGTIKLHELKRVLEERFEVTDEDALQIFESLDSTNSEDVHYSEFLAAMMASRIKIHEDLVLAAFAKFDVNSSGAISVDNLQEVLGESLSEEEASCLLRDAGLDSGGWISYSSFLEYLTGSDAKESHREAAGQVIETQLSKLDLDRLTARNEAKGLLSPKSSGRCDSWDASPRPLRPRGAPITAWKWSPVDSPRQEDAFSSAVVAEDASHGNVEVQVKKSRVCVVL